jgi:hypothetical protein
MASRGESGESGESGCIALPDAIVACALPDAIVVGL